MYTIKRAAELLGTNEATLRAWERRYGVGAERRSEAGYRIYDEEALHALRLMGSLVAEGWSVRAAAEETRRLAAPAPAREHAAALDQDLADSEALVRVAATLDGDGLTALLDRRFAATSVESVLDDWLLPSLHDLGRAWESGRVSVAGEHLVAHGVVRRLGAVYEAAGESPTGARVVIGLPAGSTHELGVLSFAVAARRAGLRTSYLGADVPVTDWVAAVTTLAAASPVPCVAALAVPTAADVEQACATVEALLAAAPGLRVFAGGACQDRLPAGCVRLGHRVGVAAAALARELHRS